METLNGHIIDRPSKLMKPETPNNVLAALACNGTKLIAVIVSRERIWNMYTNTLITLIRSLLKTNVSL